jgi:hypothetical protein
MKKNTVSKLMALFIAILFLGTALVVAVSSIYGG